MRIDHGNGTTYFVTYDSWGEYLDHISAGETFPGAASHAASDDRDTWSGGSWTLALQLARDGWPEGEAALKRFSLPLVDRVSQMIERPYIVYDVEGSEIDIARYLDGEPECWQRFEVRTTAGPGRRIIKIRINASASASVGPDTIRTRGAAVGALVELLELGGHGVQLDLCKSVATYPGKPASLGYSVRLKDAEQPLDIPRIAYALVHPTSARRLGFAAYEQAPAPVRNAHGVKRGGNYGYPSTFPADAADADITFDRMASDEPQWSSPAAAEAWTIQTLEAQGVTLRKE